MPHYLLRSADIRLHGPADTMPSVIRRAPTARDACLDAWRCVDPYWLRSQNDCIIADNIHDESDSAAVDYREFRAERWTRR